jgi:glucose-1-phosphate cytidylyltransferase
MQVIILAGGRGSRLAEETHATPKPMVSVGSKPILWHIMKLFAMQGLRDFVIATGYLHQRIDEWANNLSSEWRIRTVFTGMETQTGGRIKKCIDESDSSDFIVTYGDGLANVNLRHLIDFHAKHGCIATVTAVRPPARFGVLQINGALVEHFGEKNQADAGWINGGFFALKRDVVKYIYGDDDLFETGALPALAKIGELAAFKHNGFWQPMDTLRERQILEELALKPIPPWFEIEV